MVMAVARIEKVFGWFQKDLGLKTIIHDFLMKLCLFIMGRGEKKAITAKNHVSRGNKIARGICQITPTESSLLSICSDNSLIYSTCNLSLCQPKVSKGTLFISSIWGRDVAYLDRK